MGAGPAEPAAAIVFDFDFESLYWPKVPMIGIFFLFLLAALGLELDFSRCRVLPFFSEEMIGGIRSKGC